MGVVAGGLDGVQRQGSGRSGRAGLRGHPRGEMVDPSLGPAKWCPLGALASSQEGLPLKSGVPVPLDPAGEMQVPPAGRLWNTPHRWDPGTPLMRGQYHRTGGHISSHAHSLKEHPIPHPTHARGIHQPAVVFRQ